MAGICPVNGIGGKETDSIGTLTRLICWDQVLVHGVSPFRLYEK
jgi:hypothetical protein